MRKFKTVFKTL